MTLRYCGSDTGGSSDERRDDSAHVHITQSVFHSERVQVLQDTGRRLHRDALHTNDRAEEHTGRCGKWDRRNEC